MALEPTAAPIPLPTSGYDEIRAVLMPTLTPSQLSDDTISMSVYQGAAERMVMRQIPNADTRLGDERIYRAVIYYTAAFIAPVLPQVLQADVSDVMNYKVREINWGARSAQLLGMAQGEIGDVASDTPADVPRPHFFTLAKGRRG